MPSIAFIIPGRLHPGYSLLGRALRRVMGDSLRAEAHHILAVAALALLPATIHAVAMLTSLPAPSWSLHGAVILLILLTAVVGWKPRIGVRVEDGRLSAESGRRTWSISLDEIEKAEIITTIHYHRHYRRYAVTRSFIGRPEPHFLLLRTPRGPVVLGLTGRDQSEFLHHLENHRSIQVA